MKGSEKDKKARAMVRISGLVQGIGFRPFVYRLAFEKGLKGYVKNLGDAGVEVLIEGKEVDIKAFLADFKDKRPPQALYTKIDVEWLDYRGEYNTFTIDESDAIRRNVSLSIIPPDISVCEDCHKDIFNPKDRHFLYPFTCCAICGPRFTVIKNLPYDRDRTTMEDFPMCQECSHEYNNPLDRRFNAQTICCPKCGPKMTLYDHTGRIMEGQKDSMEEATRLLGEGFILAIKGIGGIHLSVGTIEDEPLMRLRKRRRKPNKPFAIMSPCLEEVRKYAIVSEYEGELLTSYARPIVVLRKQDPFPLSDLISPGLDTVGVMLPYSGIHYIIFHYLKPKQPALVMTSANFPGEPMVISNKEAFERLRGIADYFLLHNRDIWARCDDSVLRIIDGRRIFLRRSRGYVPMPITLPFSSNFTIAAVGAELSSTAAILKNDRAYLTQHIGDLEGPDSLTFLKGTLKHFIGLLGLSRVDAIACDMHPAFLSRTVASELSEELGIPIIDVQHHHAHLASLMAEVRIAPGEEVVGIVCDGYGYGIDGAPWGGEILVGGYKGFERVGHLEPQPMPGGDLCTQRYGRMLQGILYKEMPREELREFLIKECIEGFQRGSMEIDMVFDQMEKEIHTPKTTSAGRLLDAVSCLLGIAFKRTYEGEGAIKLEAFAAKGVRNSLELPIEIEDRRNTLVLKTSRMVKAVFELRNFHRREDLASAFQKALGTGLAEMAIRIARERGIGLIGFTGGVAYNEAINQVIRRRVEREGYRFLRHELVPCGDGGLSLGQAAIASFKA
ncbi:carbamoyltransferase HypF [Candidatus Bathyarchaeota archaeon]|nr:carbamoyltransferase HypF [Candidatus Bathyarchaeota archaeon]